MSLAYGLGAQEVIADLKLKKFPTDTDEVYPYYGTIRNQPFQFLQHDPIVKVDPGSFLHLWRKEFSSYQKRLLTRYDILLAETWTTEIELARQEEIIDFFISGELAVVLTHSYRSLNGQHIVMARTFRLEDGSQDDAVVLWNKSGRSSVELEFTFSPNKQYRLFYQIINTRGIGAYSQLEYLRQDATLGRIIGKGELIAFKLVDQDLSIIWEDTIRWNGRQSVLLGLDTDDEGCVYASYYDRKQQQITVEQHCHRQKPIRLNAPNVLEWKDFIDPFSTMLPLKVGMSKHMYLATATRITKGKLRGTKSFTITDFDFEKEEVSDQRHVEVSSGLKVLVEKTREEFNLKPLRRFDNYTIQDLLLLPNGTIWMFAQHYETTVAVRAFDNTSSRLEEERYEEIILIEFTPDQKPQKAIVVPSLQEFAYPNEYLNYPFHYSLDESQKTLRIITWEPSDDKLRDPERPFLRLIDLDNGQTSERQQLFEGKRRYQFFPMGFLEWLNPDLLSLLVIDGDEGNARLVTLNTTAEAKEEEE